MSSKDQFLIQNALECIQKMELDKAEALLNEALLLTPAHPDILRFLSVVAAHKSDYQTALSFIDKSIALAPFNGIAHSNRGNILKALGRLDEALDSHDEAIKLLPEYAEAYNNKANVLQDLHRYEESLLCYDKAIALEPTYIDAYCNKGNALEWLRRHEEAMENFNKATALDPCRFDAYWQKAVSQLAVGNYELGWQNYEARWSKSNPVIFQYADISRLVSLQNLAGKKILVWSEQGLGDTIQFSRYIKDLTSKRASVTFLVPDQLLAVLSPFKEFCSLRSQSLEINEPFDFQTPLMSLPLLFGTSVKSIPCNTPYLKSDESKRKNFQELFAESSNLKVGIVWSGGFRLIHTDGYADFQRRNIGLNQISVLKDIPGVDFYSLQKGDPAESELLIRKNELWPGIINLGPYLNDFSDTAALIDHLDLIISVDTSTAHLAGALGKPVWMLNRFDSCWRWLRGRKDSPWYPTMTIYQQDVPGEWSHAIDMVKADLLALSHLHTKNKI
ncbi:hypothetical protein AOC10_00710 [Polynucleobacter asymbioticus]|jgi:Flp pilus assembly protein TadD|uniref:tetratricopeptide repeat protein n=1 Tax=Polynucleobacter asymbioticus TaxID=576611 RepID=UPI0008FB5681|nr:tetratricopeptide repeat protein [Polynucleobacter asymbioticus]APC05153.1 hypothetical protein AOC10_00710 [Polynucleobacter asymbioticus]